MAPFDFSSGSQSAKGTGGYLDVAEATTRLSADISKHDLKQAAELTGASKRELGVTLLYATGEPEPLRHALAMTFLYEQGLCTSTLTAFIRQRSGGLMPLVGNDWKTASLWRQILAHGVIRALPGEPLAQHDSESVILETLALEAWRAQRLHGSVVAEDEGTAALKTLLPEILDEVPFPAPEHRRHGWKDLWLEKATAAINARHKRKPTTRGNVERRMYELKFWPDS